MKTALYGGSFDPVHNAHVEIISNLSKLFDKVVVMPTAISPFKLQGGCANAEHRLNMLHLCNFSDNVQISDYEIKKGGISYTADTIRYLLQCGYDHISVVIGSEELPNLYKWKEIDFINQFGFFIIPRPGFSIEQNKDYNIEIANFTGKEVSSAMIRVDVAFDNSLQTPKRVEEYILSNNLYDEWKIYTSEYLQFNMKPSRIKHTYGCIKAGIELAKRFNGNINSVITALLLHDIGKYTNKEFLQKKGIYTQNFVENLPEPLRHAYYSEAIASQYFNITDKTILNAIKNHTTCDIDMDVCSEITALADYIEEGRNFDGVEEVRALAKLSLKKAVAKMLGITLNYLKSVNADIGEQSIKAYEFYKNFL